jgi:hypothetical protein
MLTSFKKKAIRLEVVNVMKIKKHKVASEK